MASPDCRSAASRCPAGRCSASSSEEGLDRIDAIKVDVEGVEDRDPRPVLRHRTAPTLWPHLLLIEDNRSAWQVDLLGPLERSGYATVLATAATLVSAAARIAVHAERSSVVANRDEAAQTAASIVTAALLRDRRRDPVRAHQGQEHRLHRRPPHRHRHPAEGGARRPRRGAGDRRRRQRAAHALHLRVHHRRHRPHPRRHHRRCHRQGVRRRHRRRRARARSHEGLFRAPRRRADARTAAHGAHPLRRRAGGEQRVDRAGLHAGQRRRHGRHPRRSCR